MESIHSLLITRCFLSTDSLSRVFRQEWRVLRFNNVTRQSVNYVRCWHENGACEAVIQPECLAFEYLKTMASVGNCHTRIGI